MHWLLPNQQQRQLFIIFLLEAKKEHPLTFQESRQAFWGVATPNPLLLIPDYDMIILCFVLYCWNDLKWVSLWPWETKSVIFVQNLLELLFPQNQTLRVSIEEVLDLQLIEQKAVHGTLDISYYASYVIDVMSRMCAPVRDEEIVALKQFTDIVTIYKWVLEVFENV